MYFVVLRSIVIVRKNILLLIISPVLFLLDYIAFHYFAELELTRHMVSPIRPPYCDTDKCSIDLSAKAVPTLQHNSRLQAQSAY